MGDKFVRLAPSVPRKFGSLRATKALAYHNWLLDLKFQIGGRGLLGGEGLGLWFSPSLPLVSSSDKLASEGMAGLAISSFTGK
jgi:hypothetical protein